jgi:WXG100 family type VII secretion target
MTSSGAVLQDASSHAKETAERLAQEVQQLSSELSEFLSSGWQGQASDKYRAAFDEWSDGAKKIHAWLTSLGERLGEAAKEYAQAEEANQALLKSAKVNSAEG